AAALVRRGRQGGAACARAAGRPWSRRAVAPRPPERRAGGRALPLGAGGPALGRSRAAPGRRSGGRRQRRHADARDRAPGRLGRARRRAAAGPQPAPGAARGGAPLMRGPRRAGGFTLIEVLLATVLLAAGLALAFATLTAANGTALRGERLANKSERMRAV